MKNSGSYARFFAWACFFRHFPAGPTYPKKAIILKSDDPHYTKVNIHINWVKQLVNAQWGEQSFINYGNESFSDHAYHNICLIVKVGKPGRRGIPEAPTPISNEDDLGDEHGSSEDSEGHGGELGEDED